MYFESFPIWCIVNKEPPTVVSSLFSRFLRYPIQSTCFIFLGLKSPLAQLQHQNPPPTPPPPPPPSCFANSRSPSPCVGSSTQSSGDPQRFPTSHKLGLLLVFLDGLVPSTPPTQTQAPNTPLCAVCYISLSFVVSLDLFFFLPLEPAPGHESRSESLPDSSSSL